MTGLGWETLAAQAPIVLIFAGAVFFLMREQYRNNKSMMDTFMTFMEKRDAAINESLRRIADCLDHHDYESKAHNQLVAEKWKELSK